MVHALTEVWRVLAAGGRLVDLRPVAANWPLDVLVNGKVALTGRLIHIPPTESQKAANRAIVTVVQNGLFTKEKEAFFAHAYYWPTLSDMEAYLATEWSERVTVPEPLIVKVRFLMKQNPTCSKLRIRRKIMIASYRRLE